MRIEGNTTLRLPLQNYTMWGIKEIISSATSLLSNDNLKCVIQGPSFSEIIHKLFSSNQGVPVVWTFWFSHREEMKQ